MAVSDEGKRLVGFDPDVFLRGDYITDDFPESVITYSDPPFWLILEITEQCVFKRIRLFDANYIFNKN